MDMEVVSKCKEYEDFTNGWIGQPHAVPKHQYELSYIVDGKKATQNYLNYEDFAIVIPIRKNSKTGLFEFGLVEQEAPGLVSTR